MPFYVFQNLKNRQAALGNRNASDSCSEVGWKQQKAKTCVLKWAVHKTGCVILHKMLNHYVKVTEVGDNDIYSCLSCLLLLLRTTVFVQRSKTYLFLHKYLLSSYYNPVNNAFLLSLLLLSLLLLSSYSFDKWGSWHIKNLGDFFRGGTVIKTPPFQCRGHGFDPWSGS